jgi:hypothetical protein
VPADGLLGEPAPEIRPNGQMYNIAPLQRALLDASPDDPPDIPARPLTRNNPFIRELVQDMLTRARREAGGRDLRGLAWRMNLI